MARPIEFSREQALESAIEVFWDKGYEASSMDDLVNAMGIGRQSLYNSFKDKHNLFIEAIALQVDKFGAHLREHFAQEKPIRELFAEWFDEIGRRGERDKRRGCMVINSAMELAGRDLQVADTVARHQRIQEEVFYNALCRAKQNGELASDFDCQKVARYLVGCSAGLIVMAKSDPSSPCLDALAQTALQVLSK